MRKGAILRTMVLPRLLYGAGAWPVLSKSEGHKFEATVLGMYRQLLCIRYDDSQHLAAPTICALARQPPPSVLLHLERLWCLRGLVVHGPPVLWGLVRQDDEYLSALRGSPTWLYARVHACVDMPHPCQDWGPWEDCIRRVPNRYKRLLNLASGLAASRSACLGALCELHGCLLSHVGGLTPSRPAMQEADYPEACLICRVGFPSRRSWAGHAARVHGYRAVSTVLAEGRTCQACGRVFRNPGRLERHLRGATHCRAGWGGFVATDAGSEAAMHPGPASRPCHFASPPGEPAFAGQPS